MSIEYQKQNDRVTKVLRDGEQVGVITNRNGTLGFRIFGEPVGGSVESRDEAKKQIEEHFN